MGSHDYGTMNRLDAGLQRYRRYCSQLELASRAFRVEGRQDAICEIYIINSRGESYLSLYVLFPHFFRSRLIKQLILYTTDDSFSSIFQTFFIEIKSSNMYYIFAYKKTNAYGNKIKIQKTYFFWYSS